ncbi:MAG: GDSL-type esterase/lipase family protein [Vicinamibacteria bacterium]
MGRGRARGATTALAAAGATAALATACVHPLPPAAPGVERIVFVGDSLVNRSSGDHGLIDRVREDLESRRPGTAFEIVNAGVNGDRIADIRARLAADVLALAPAAVLLYWDSDAADAEEGEEEAASRARLRAEYERHLDAVLGALRASVRHVVVAGPTLDGEGPRGSNPKDHVLDAYAAINHRLARRHHAAWVDTRRAAFEWLGRHRPAGSRGLLLTEDGEHLNATGARLVADEIAAALDRALRRRDRPAAGDGTEAEPH